MKVISYLFLIIIICACSVFNKRSPSSANNLFSYQKNGLNFVELNVELSDLKNRILVPKFTLNSTGHDEEVAELRITHESTVECQYDNQSEIKAMCTLVSGTRGKIKIVYSFSEYETFPIYEVDWASNKIKSKFSNIDIIKSKIHRKANRNRDLNSLFLNEKVSLLNIMGKEQKIKLNFTKKKNIRIDDTKMDVISIKNITSDIVHKTLGQIPINGVDRKSLPDDSFENENLNAYEFYCEANDESYLLEDEMILVQDHNGKVKCHFNDRIRGVFGRYYARGNVHFSVISLDIEEAVLELENSENLNNQKLKEIINKINEDNINYVFNKLSKIQSIYGL